MELRARASGLEKAKSPHDWAASQVHAFHRQPCHRRVLLKACTWRGIPPQKGNATLVNRASHIVSKDACSKSFAKRFRYALIMRLNAPNRAISLSGSACEIQGKDEK